MNFRNFAARRKSNCVKEVEKIQQKRDERRAKHLAIKEQNEQQFDTADPNWEFQAMIKWVPLVRKESNKVQWLSYGDKDTLLVWQFLFITLSL